MLLFFLFSLVAFVECHKNHIPKLCRAQENGVTYHKIAEFCADRGLAVNQGHFAENSTILENMDSDMDMDKLCISKNMASNQDSAKLSKLQYLCDPHYFHLLLRTASDFAVDFPKYTTINFVDNFVSRMWDLPKVEQKQILNTHFRHNQDELEDLLTILQIL